MFLVSISGRHVLCIVPINTIQNWISEFNSWLPKEKAGTEDKAEGGRSFGVYVLNDALKNLESRGQVNCSVAFYIDSLF